MADKTKFIENIQKWVKIDNEIKTINERVKKARELKSEIMNNIVEYANENNITNTKIEISDGELRFFQKKDYQPITFGYIEECLGKIISDKKQVEYILDYLREHRKISSSTDIKRNYKASSPSI
jgi:hypothetical protein